ncbi:hypothetical protein [Flavobacterium maritimum]|uniref:hypothetical protein n=1 Tax=Flavobacterium maritimum TaxID=3149042 RepID=UPI0032B470BE
MFWLTVNFFTLVQQLLPKEFKNNETFHYLKAIITPVNRIYNETLYKMQHDGITINLEKMLNEYFKVAGYDHQNHETTKTVYIDDIPEPPKLYIFQDEEEEVIFLKDDGDDSDDDIFLDNDNENVVSYTWIIFIPDTYVFQEERIRALVDTYRYFGNKYKIQTYTL